VPPDYQSHLPELYTPFVGDTSSYDCAVDVISIADLVARRLIPGERLCDLARNSLCCTALGHTDPNKALAIQTDNFQHIEQFEVDRGNDEQIHRRNLNCAIGQERPSACPPPLGHVKQHVFGELTAARPER
jgi:hypothetical protein